MGSRYCATTRPGGMGVEVSSLAAGAASGAAAGSALGPYGTVGGALVGAAASLTSGAGKTSHGGPGSWTYWAAQDARMVALTQSGNRDVAAAAKQLRQHYHDLQHQTSGKGYPVVPEQQLAALEQADAASPKSLVAGFDLQSIILFGAGLAAFAAWNIYRGRGARRRSRR